MNRPFLRAGLLGGVALALVDLLGLVPVVGCISLPLLLVGYVGVGALAAYWLPPRRESGSSAGAGALAGLVAGLISGLAQAALAPLSLNLAGGPQTFVNQLPAESLSQLEQLGVDPAALLSGGTFAVLSLLCCLPVVLVLGAGLGALGGLILAAAKPE